MATGRELGRGEMPVRAAAPGRRAATPDPAVRRRGWSLPRIVVLIALAGAGVYGARACAGDGTASVLPAPMD